MTAYVEVEDISVRYRVREHHSLSLKEYFLHWFSGNRSSKEIWALRNVSIRVAEPGCIGLVGRNGAGKSTLLKVVSGILRPEFGSVHREGSVAPILALGTGFDHELSGRENILLNALLLGRTRRETMDRSDAIIEFSGISSSIDRPLKTYSTGMVARLAFSIATEWTPGILILDEILTVGDISFQSRCQQRIDQLAREGTIIFTVTHSINVMESTCKRAIWLDRGSVRMDGDATEVANAYREAVAASATAKLDED